MADDNPLDSPGSKDADPKGKKNLKSQHILIAIGIITLVVIVLISRKSSGGSSANQNAALQQAATAAAAAQQAQDQETLDGMGVSGSSGSTGTDDPYADALIQFLESQISTSATGTGTGTGTGGSPTVQPGGPVVPVGGSPTTYGPPNTTTPDLTTTSQGAGSGPSSASSGAQEPEGLNFYSGVTAQLGSVMVTPTQVVPGGANEDYLGVGNADILGELENEGYMAYEDINGTFVQANSAAGKAGASTHPGRYVLQSTL